MLISFSECQRKLAQMGIHIKGILHVGAHECEEMSAYHAGGVTGVDWVEANPELVDRMAKRGVSVHHAVISNEEGEVPFHITNNGQSSSLLPFGTHATSYPWCKVEKTITLKTTTLEKLIQEKHIPIEDRNFWNLDIQGVELRGLESAGDAIRCAYAIYTEVNTQYVYQGCALLSEIDAFLSSKGFVRCALAMTDHGWGDALYARGKSSPTTEQS
jgi:FkbM family methyltransferase